MLSILGMGVAHPSNIITNDFLYSLFNSEGERELITRSGVFERRTCLPLDYIAKTRNECTAEALKAAVETPTDLSFRAVKIALKEAQIEPEQLGLIIGETLTPRETTPCEAQRVGGRLGTKIRAYDLTTAGTSFIAHLDCLKSKREDTLPDYILLLSSSTMTTVADYKKAADAAILGDGAFAMVVSPRKPGPLKVIETGYSSEPSLHDHAAISTYGHFSWDRAATQEFIVGRTLETLRGLNSHFNPTSTLFIGQQWDSESLQGIVSEFKVERHLSNLAKYGFVGGAGAGSVLAEHLTEITSGNRAVVALAGLDLSWGFALLGAE